ncbi:hypothetical protein KR009_003969 [Drosophila setifemur]|nr:hypothetical protein KR009_003969 [Drosophila setifemur]
MLLDAIFFIPTLFTYLLILLLIFILCFIVIYISHKIYISIYDNLPLADLPGSREPSMRSNHVMTFREFIEGSLRSSRSNQPSMRSLWVQNQSQILESSTVVRVVLSLEPCYLVSIEFDVSPSRRTMSFLCTCDREEPVCAATEPRPSGQIHIIRYYDHLSKIPRLKLMLKCSMRRSSQRRDGLTLDEVIEEAREAQGTDSSDPCRPPSHFRGGARPGPD